MTILGLDADQDLTNFAPAIKAAGLSFVCRYLKNMRSHEVAALHAAGLSIVCIFESTATRSLEGADAGTADAKTAMGQMRALGAPSSAAIYATVDSDAGEADLAAIEAYFVAFDAVLWGHCKIGGYADGTVISRLRADGMPYCWLAGASGWDGSRDFIDPTMMQGPTIAADTEHEWHGENWPALPFDYDPNLAFTDDYGQWAPPS